ncbi:hypothetical protein Gorai_010540, partial [Gossypium raimondii]|nr:hypothetical protein [Gossypium raimondii]
MWTERKFSIKVDLVAKFKVSLQLFVLDQLVLDTMQHKLHGFSYISALQIPDVRTGDDIIDAVVVDEEAVELKGRGSGAKILYGKGALDSYLSQPKLKDLETSGEPEVETELLPSVVAS